MLTASCSESNGRCWVGEFAWGEAGDKNHCEGSLERREQSQEGGEAVRKELAWLRITAKAKVGEVSCRCRVELCGGSLAVPEETQNKSRTGQVKRL